MEFEPYMSQVLKIPKSTEALSDLEIDWIVGPIPIEDGNGKEFIHKITLNQWNNTGKFYTDANGRQNVQRIRDHRYLSTHTYSSVPNTRTCALIFFEKKIHPVRSY